MKHGLKAIGLVGALLACFGFGFAWRDLRHGELPDSGAVGRLFSSMGNREEPSPERIFRDSYNKILGSYSKPVKPLDLKYAGIAGMVASLGDPHTMFLEPKIAEEFASETKANFVGIGARLQEDPLGVKAARVFPTGPAAKAGMKSGDVISSVDGVATAGRDINEVVDSIRGKEGTYVRLQIMRPGEPKPVALAIQRGRVIIPTVEGEYLKDSGVGYLNVSSFSEPTASQFDEELARLEKNKLKGLVIDVRGNPGGLLETAREMLSRFAENKLVVKMRFRDGSEETARTYGGLTHRFSYPVVVLIDGSSASAAEIFAGALRDYRLATLVGSKSYGKASVQNVFPFVDKASAKITIAKYFLPSSGDIGRMLDDDGHVIKGGLAPDYDVKLDDYLGQLVPGDPAKDPQLKKAIEVIQQSR